jgi:hypothetical protein
VSWDLLLSLFPSNSEFGMQSQTPRFRDWATETTPATRADLLATLEAAGSLVLRFAKADPARWEEIVPKFDRLPPDVRTEAITGMLALSADDLTAEQSNALWGALDGYVRHHREYADAQWSLSEDWLGQLAEVAQSLTPTKSADVNR